MTTTQIMNFDLEAYAQMDAEEKEKYLLCFCIKPNPNHIMNEREVAGLLKISVTKLRQLRREGKGPAHVLIGKATHYQYQDIEEWLNQLPTSKKLQETITND